MRAKTICGFTAEFTAEFTAHIVFARICIKSSNILYWLRFAQKWWISDRSEKPANFRFCASSTRLVGGWLGFILLPVVYTIPRESSELWAFPWLYIVLVLDSSTRFGRCALPRAASPSAAKPAIWRCSRSAQCMDSNKTSKMQSCKIVFVYR